MIESSAELRVDDRRPGSGSSWPLVSNMFEIYFSNMLEQCDLNHEEKNVSIEISSSSLLRPKALLTVINITDDQSYKQQQGHHKTPQ